MCVCVGGGGGAMAGVAGVVPPALSCVKNARLTDCPFSQVFVVNAKDALNLVTC